MTPEHHKMCNECARSKICVWHGNGVAWAASFATSFCGYVVLYQKLRVFQQLGGTIEGRACHIGTLESWQTAASGCAAKDCQCSTQCACTCVRTDWWEVPLDWGDNCSFIILQASLCLQRNQAYTYVLQTTTSPTSGCTTTTLPPTCSRCTHMSWYVLQSLWTRQCACYVCNGRPLGLEWSE